MTVLSFVADDLFVIRVIKYLSTNPDNKWANSYEFQATAGGDEGDLLTLGNVLVQFEATFHRTAVVFDRILISTWAEDSVPYDPATFISSTLTATGAVAIGGQLQALNTTLSVARIASSGRFGHLFYRGILEELDIGAPAGKAVLVSRAAQQVKIDDAAEDSGFDAYFGEAPTGSLRMVMVNKAGDQIRPVNQLRVQGVSTIPTDHAWFNRTPAP
jgi:hypothetical protein